jgi:hypothetical protein
MKPDPELVFKYGVMLPRYALDEAGTMPRKVGLCWSSSDQSMHFDDVRPLLKAGEWVNDFVNLQVGPERSQHGYSVIDVLPKTPTWDDIAALIANLDLVITVDTAIADCASAMGKQVWVITKRDDVDKFCQAIVAERAVPAA